MAFFDVPRANGSHHEKRATGYMNLWGNQSSDRCGDLFVSTSDSSTNLSTSIFPMKSPPQDRPVPRRRIFDLMIGGGLTAMLPGCVSPERGQAVPDRGTTQASALGIANERFFPLVSGEALEKEFAAAGERRNRALGTATKSTIIVPQLLAVSGGAENGAFGAGLLCGWSELGSRPSFELVTGVSTGALTASFVFLGSKYDAQLRSVYTDLTPDDVLKSRGLIAAIYDDAVADNLPLLRTISRHLNETMLADIAAGYDEGRLLLVATTHLDARQPVIWNIGAIAKSGHPMALNLVRRILLASAAVPGAFPPTMIDVTLAGQQYQEMHVDGGAFAQAFLYPTTVDKLRRARKAHRPATPPAVAYIIRNGRLDPEWVAVERRTLGIAMAAIATMITASGNSDVVQIYNSTQRDGIDFNLAYIGKDFSTQMPTPFDQGYMRALFDYGYQRGLQGYQWVKRPPT